MPPNLKLSVFRVATLITWQRHARSNQQPPPPASAAQCVTPSATPPGTVRSFFEPPLTQLMPPRIPIRVPMPPAARPTTTPTAGYSTSAVFVTAEHAAPTHTPAPGAMVGTPSAPAPWGRCAKTPPLHVHTVHTPLRPQVFARLLQHHPNQAFVSWLIHSLTYGFNIGYLGPNMPLTAPNLRSAHLHPTVIDAALTGELTENRIAGPYSAPPCPALRCSGLGVVPKKDGGWRLIHHLSAPHDHSINDHIDPNECSLQYCTVDDAIALCQDIGTGALMAKVDLKNAFRLCPVRQEDWHLLGMYWRNHYFVDKCLPFGLRSAPYLFNTVADAIEWMLRHHFNVHSCFHYLDDFFLVGPPLSEACIQALSDLLLLCRLLGAPVKPEKVLGPATTLPVLGIELDTIAGLARLPEDKLQALLAELDQFQRMATDYRCCTKRQLLSLIGKLAFACKVIPAGRIFLRRLLDRAHSTSHLDTRLTVDHEAAEDIRWWQSFASPPTSDSAQSTASLPSLRQS